MSPMPPYPEGALSAEDFDTVAAITTEDTALALDMARRLQSEGNADDALVLLASKLALMDLRFQDTEATLSVALTHATTYAEAIGAGQIGVPPEERQAIRNLLAFAFDARPKSSLADIVFRVRRLATNDAAHRFSIDN